MFNFSFRDWLKEWLEVDRAPVIAEAESSWNPPDASERSWADDSVPWDELDRYLQEERLRR